MTELVTEAKTLIVHLECEACKAGTMQFDFNAPVLLSYPPLYTHRCYNCGHIENLHQRYPYTKLVPVGELREPTEEEKGAYKNG